MANEQREEPSLLDAEVARRLGEEGRDVLLCRGESRLGDVGAGGKSQAPGLYELGMVIVRQRYECRMTLQLGSPSLRVAELPTLEA